MKKPPVVQMPTHRPAGELLALLGPVAYGWAILPDSPDEKAIVEILADGLPIGTTVADVFDEDIHARLGGDGCFAFVFPLPRRIVEQGSRITARLANLGILLAGSLETQPSEDLASAKHMLRVIRNHGDLRITGWVWNPLEPTLPQQVSFYAGNECIGTCDADEPCAELIDKGFGDGSFGFSYTLPVRYRDGKKHEIRVLSEDTELARFEICAISTESEHLLDRLLAMPEAGTNPALHACLKSLQGEREVTQRYLPNSFDFSAYAAWSAAYGNANTSPEPEAPVADYLVLIEGEEDPSPTLQSLQQQTGATWRALCRSMPDGAQCAASNTKSVPPSRWIKELRAAIAKHRGLITSIRSGDTLRADALARLAQALNDNVSCAYSDCDGPGRREGLRMPWCKPQWDPHYYFATGYANHLFACHARALAGRVDLIESASDIAEIALGNAPDRHHIAHVPEILCHHTQWPLPPDPEKASVQNALATWLPKHRLGPGAPYNRLSPAKISRWPSVSLIIPTRDRLDLLRPCIDSLLASDYPDLEIIVADNDSTDPATLKYLHSLQRKTNCQVIAAPGSFNYSRINNLAVARAKGKLIGLINNDIEAKDPAWLKTMVAHLHAPGIGAVGAKLVWPTGMVQHAGVVTGMHGVAGHIGNSWSETDTGYFGLNQVSHRVACVTAACLIVRADDYRAVGGLDEAELKVNFNDVDFCLKLRNRGQEILWTPDAQLLHHESASRGMDHQAPDKAGRAWRERSALLEKWGERLWTDPYYNPNLNLDRYPYTGMAVPPRRRTVRN